MIYSLKRLRYAYLYVDGKRSAKIMENIKRITGVTNVEPSLIDMNEYSFVL